MLHKAEFFHDNDEFEPWTFRETDSSFDRDSFYRVQLFQNVHYFLVSVINFAQKIKLKAPDLIQTDPAGMFFSYFYLFYNFRPTR